MKTYEVELDDGRIFEVDADQEPTHDEVMQALGLSQPQQPMQVTDQSLAASSGNQFLRDIGSVIPNIVGGIGDISEAGVRNWNPVAWAAKAGVPGAQSLVDLYAKPGEFLSGTVADSMTGKLEEMTPTNPLYADSFTQKASGAVGQGVGQLASFAVPAKVLGLAPSVARAVGLGGAFAQGAKSGTDTAEAYGIEDDLTKAAMTLGFGGIETVTEKLGGLGAKGPTEAILGMLRSATRPGNVISRAAKTIGSEAGEEIVAGQAQDWLTGAVVQEDPNRPGFATNGAPLPPDTFTMENLKNRLEEGALGAVGGAVFAGAEALGSRTPIDEALAARMQARARVEELRDKDSLTTEEQNELSQIEAEDQNVSAWLNRQGLERTRPIVDSFAQNPQSLADTLANMAQSQGREREAAVWRSDRGLEQASREIEQYKGLMDSLSQAESAGNAEAADMARNALENHVLGSLNPLSRPSQERSLGQTYRERVDRLKARVEAANPIEQASMAANDALVNKVAETAPQTARALQQILSTPLPSVETQTTDEDASTIQSTTQMGGLHSGTQGTGESGTAGVDVLNQGQAPTGTSPQEEVNAPLPQSPQQPPISQPSAQEDPDFPFRKLSERQLNNAPVPVADAEFAKQSYLQANPEREHFIQDAWFGSSKDLYKNTEMREAYLEQKSLGREKPFTPRERELAWRLFIDQPHEALEFRGKAYVLLDKVVVTNTDLQRAVQYGMSPNQWAVRRLLAHEDRHILTGWMNSSDEFGAELRALADQIPAEQLDDLAKRRYPTFSNWRESDLSKRALQFEWFSEQAESDSPTNPSLLQQFLELLRKLYAKALNIRPEDVTDMELREFLKRASKAQADYVLQQQAKYDQGEIRTSMPEQAVGFPAVPETPDAFEDWIPVVDKDRAKQLAWESFYRSNADENGNVDLPALTAAWEQEIARPDSPFLDAGQTEAFMEARSRPPEVYTPTPLQTEQETEQLSLGSNEPSTPRVEFSSVELSELAKTGATVGDALALIASDPNSPFNELAAEIQDVIQEDDAKARFEVQRPKDSEQGRAFYYPSEHTIRMGTGGEGQHRTAIHEIIHAMTTRKLDKSIGADAKSGKEYRKQLQAALKNDKIPQPVRDLIDLYFKTADALGYSQTMWEGAPGQQQRARLRFYEHLGAIGGPQVTVYQKPHFITNVFSEELPVAKAFLNEQGAVLNKDYWTSSAGRGYGTDIHISAPFYKKLESDGLIKDRVMDIVRIPREKPTANRPDLGVKRGVPYGLGNLDEFMAEAFSNSKFQERLNQIDAGNGKTLWEKLVDAIRKLLGIPVRQGSVLESVLRATVDISKLSPASKFADVARGMQSSLPEMTPEERRARLKEISDISSYQTSAQQEEGQSPSQATQDERIFTESGRKAEFYRMSQTRVGQNALAAEQLNLLTEESPDGPSEDFGRNLMDYLSGKAPDIFGHSGSDNSKLNLLNYLDTHAQERNQLGIDGAEVERVRSQRLSQMGAGLQSAANSIYQPLKETKDKANELTDKAADAELGSSDFESMTKELQADVTKDTKARVDEVTPEMVDSFDAAAMADVNLLGYALALESFDEKTRAQIVDMLNELEELEDLLRLEAEMTAGPDVVQFSRPDIRSQKLTLAEVRKRIAQKQQKITKLVEDINKAKSQNPVEEAKKIRQRVKKPRTPEFTSAQNERMRGWVKGGKIEGVPTLYTSTKKYIQSSGLNREALTKFLTTTFPEADPNYISGIVNRMGDLLDGVATKEGILDDLKRSGVSDPKMVEKMLKIAEKAAVGKEKAIEAFKKKLAKVKNPSPKKLKQRSAFVNSVLGALETGMLDSEAVKDSFAEAYDLHGLTQARLQEMGEILQKIEAMPDGIPKETLFGEFNFILNSLAPTAKFTTFAHEALMGYVLSGASTMAMQLTGVNRFLNPLSGALEALWTAPGTTTQRIGRTFNPKNLFRLYLDGLNEVRKNIPQISAGVSGLLDSQPYGVGAFPTSLANVRANEASMSYTPWGQISKYRFQTPKLLKAMGLEKMVNLTKYPAWTVSRSFQVIRGAEGLIGTADRSMQWRIQMTSALMAANKKLSWNDAYSKVSDALGDKTSELWTDALKQAKQEVEKELVHKHSLNARANELVQEKLEEQWGKNLKNRQREIAALYGFKQEPLTPLGTWAYGNISKLLRKNTGVMQYAKFSFLFARFFSNAIESAWSRTPVGGLFALGLPSQKADKEMDEREKRIVQIFGSLQAYKDARMARAMSGTAVMAALGGLMTLALRGWDPDDDEPPFFWITGDPIGEFSKKGLMESGGWWKANTLYIGPVRLNYVNSSPELATVMGAMGSIGDRFLFDKLLNYQENKETGEYERSNYQAYGKPVIEAFVAPVSRSTYRSWWDAAEALYAGDPTKITRLVSNPVVGTAVALSPAGLVPSFKTLEKIDRANEQPRSPQAPDQALMASVPFASELGLDAGKPLTTPFGQPLTPYPFWSFLSNTQEVPPHVAKAANTLAQLGVARLGPKEEYFGWGLAELSSDGKKYLLNDQDRAVVLAEIGNRFAQKVNAASKDLKKLEAGPDGRKKVRNKVSNLAEDARKEVLQSWRSSIKK